MKKVIKVLALLMLFSATLMRGRAETTIVQKMEGEIRAGLTLPLGGYHNGNAQVSGAIGIEGRYNFRGTPWDCGLMLELTTARRGYNHLFNDGGDR